MIRKTVRLSLVFFSAVLCTGSVASAQTVMVGYTSKTVGYIPLFAAMKKGFFKAEGLQVQLIQMGSSALQLQALIGGDLHLITTNPDILILYNEKGGNLKVIAGVNNGAPYILVGGRPFKKIDDLKGGKLGASSLKGGPTTFLIEYLRAKGLSYPRDYTLLVISGGTPARLTALETGAVAGVVLGIPASDIAIDRGFNRLGDIIEVIPQFQFTAVGTNPIWAEKNRSTVVKFLKAHILGLRWVYDHLDEAADLYMNEMGVQMPYARRGVEYWTKNALFPRDGSLTMEGLRVNIELQGKDGFLKVPLPKPEKYVDGSYLKQAQIELGRK
jgi:NitT/TauT family transport system substrate-binding protein